MESSVRKRRSKAKEPTKESSKANESSEKDVDDEPSSSEPQSIENEQSSPTEPREAPIGAPPIVWQVSVNPLLAAIIVLSLAVRIWRLEDPNQVVFDEVHFGKFVTYYTHGIYFFDVHPPLGKQLLALVAYWTNYAGLFDFDVIGREYDSQKVPYYYMRLLPALAGACVPPLGYKIAALMGFSHWSAFLAGLLLVFDNALVTQTRFILLDAWLLASIVLVLYCYLNFKRLQDKPFSWAWWKWLCCLGVSLGCAVSVKLFGAFVVLFIGLHTLHDVWHLFGDQMLPNSIVRRHFLSRALALIGIPVLIFLSTFWIEFQLLYKSGPHDSLMSLEFQATLEGSRILTHPEELPQIGQEYQVAFGSHVTLRHQAATPESDCWLHSHPHNYPLRYPDDRGSSAQQQVTCYNFRDVNNWWAIQRPGTENVTLDDPPVPVKDGDVIHLVHKSTTRRLNSHNVAAPVTPTNQEVSGYINYGNNVSVPHEEWVVKIFSGSDWTSTTSRVKLVHVHSSQTLRMTEKRLPEWAFHQLEVTTNSEAPNEGSEWLVEEIQFGIPLPGRQDGAALDSRGPRSMSFFAKFYEVVALMIVKNSELVEEHAFSSRPSEWPLADRTIAYWMSNTTSAQIQLMGNPLLWWTSSLSILGYIGLLGVYLLRRRRRFFDIDEVAWRQYVDLGWFLLGGWALHYFPFFAMGRCLFLHHYLPASVFKVILLPCWLDHVYHSVGRRWRRGVVGVGCFVGVAVVTSFWYFSAFTYGFRSLDGEAISARKWLTTWDFLVRRPDGHLGLLV